MKAERLVGEKSTIYEPLHCEYSALATSINATATQQKDAFDSAQLTRNTEFEKLTNAHKQGMENLRKTFREEIALRAPAVYWEKKVKSTNANQE